MVQAPCESCKEEIDIEAKKCPECGDKKFTRTRRDLWIVVLGPVVGFVVGTVAHVFATMSGSPAVEAWMWPAFVIGVWAVISLVVHDKYTDRKERIETAKESGGEVEPPSSADTAKSEV